jgi:hypothetical protein
MMSGPETVTFCSNAPAGPACWPCALLPAPRGGCTALIGDATPARPLWGAWRSCPARPLAGLDCRDPRAHPGASGQGLWPSAWCPTLPPPDPIRGYAAWVIPVRASPFRRRDPALCPGSVEAPLWRPPSKQEQPHAHLHRQFPYRQRVCRSGALEADTPEHALQRAREVSERDP